MEIKSEKHGKFVVHELTQKMAETIEEGMAASTEQQGVRWCGTVVRLCQQAGWLEIGEVDSMAPGTIIWLSKQLMTLYRKAFEIDPE